MNRTQRQGYASNELRVQKYIESKYLPKVYKALRLQIKFFVRLLNEGGVNYALTRFPLMDENIASVVKSIHLDAGKYSARKTRQEITRETVKRTGAAKGLAGGCEPSLQLKEGYDEMPYPLELKRTGFGFNERMVSEIQEYFRLHLLEKAVLPISATTKARIETVLNKAVVEGWGVDRIIQELQSSEFLDMTKRRARTIVRTETVRASNFGTLAAAHHSEFEQVKIWIAVNDARTRRSHKHGTGVDGEERDLLSPFSNGLMFPGDPDGPAEEVISCRCTIAIRAKRDARGRLIPKKREGLLVSLASQLLNIGRRIASIVSL